MQDLRSRLDRLEAQSGQSGQSGPKRKEQFVGKRVNTWGTPGTPFLVQIHKSCLFIVFDGFHVQDRKFTPFPIGERFFTSFWLNCVQITFTLRSNCVQITFNYVQVAQKLQCHRLKALYEKPSRTTIPVQLSNSLLFLIWTGKGVLGVPQVYKGTEKD